jgi:16S rRNA U1498 N3-methylase RsmE
MILQIAFQAGRRVHCTLAELFIPGCVLSLIVRYKVSMGASNIVLSWQQLVYIRSDNARAQVPAVTYSVALLACFACYVLSIFTMQLLARHCLA